MLYSYYYTLSPRQSQQLLWSRSVNMHGQQGRNVACDLHMEHLNRVCKEAIKGHYHILVLNSFHNYTFYNIIISQHTQLISSILVDCSASS